MQDPILYIVIDRYPLCGVADPLRYGRHERIRNNGVSFFFSYDTPGTRY